MRVSSAATASGLDSKAKRPETKASARTNSASMSGERKYSRSLCTAAMARMRKTRLPGRLNIG